MTDLTELDEFFGRPNGASANAGGRTRLGMVVGGSLSQGVQVKLDVVQ